MTPVSTAVILAAGLGTRMLPATKAVPKELLPVVDRPLIQYSVDEALLAGISTIIFGSICIGSPCIGSFSPAGWLIAIVARPAVKQSPQAARVRLVRFIRVLLISGGFWINRGQPAGSRP